MKDPFSTPVTDLKMQDWAALIPKRSEVKPLAAPRATAAATLDPMKQLLTEMRNKKQLEKQLGAPVSAPPKLEPWEKPEGFENLPYEKQAEVYDQFVDKSVKALREWNEDLDELTLTDKIHSMFPGPKKPERTFLQGAGDVALGLSSGVVSLGQSTVESFDVMRGKRSSLSKWLDSVQKSIENNYSDFQKDNKKKVDAELKAIANDPDRSATGKFLAEMGVTLKNFDAVTAANIVGQLAPFVLGMGAVNVGARTLTAGISSAAARKTAQGAITGGTTYGSTALMGAGDASMTARNIVEAAPLEILYQHEEMKELMAKHANDEKAAREELAMRAQRAAAPAGAAISLLTAAAPGSMERVLSSRLLGRDVPGLAPATPASPTLGSVAKVGAPAAALGGLEEVGVGVAGRSAAKEYDPNVKLMEGAGGDFVLGAIADGGTSAALSAVSSRGGNEAQPDQPEGPSTEDLIASQETTTPDLPEGVDYIFQVHPPEGNGPVVDIMVMEDGSARYADPNQTPVPYADAVINSFTVAQRGEEASQQVEETAQPEQEIAQPEQEIAQQEQEIAQQEQEIAQQEQEIAQQTEEITQQEQETTQPEQEVTQQEQETTQPEQEVTQPEQEVTQPEGEVTQPVAETAQPVQETTQQVEEATPDGDRIVDQAMRTPEGSTLLNNITGISYQLRSNSWLDTATDIQVGEALNSIGGYVRRLPSEVRQAIRNGHGDVSPAVRETIQTMANSIRDSSQSPWAQTATSSNNGVQVLSAIAGDPTTGANASIAAGVLNIYQRAGIDLPSVSAHDAPTHRNELALYNPTTHSIRLNPNSTANAVSHEFMHGLTVIGLNRLRERASEDDAASRDKLAAMQFLVDTFRRSDAHVPTVYNIAEMFAELARPEVIAAAERIKMPSRIPTTGAFSGNPARGLRLMSTNPNASIFQALTDALTSILNWIARRPTISRESVLQHMRNAAAEAASQTQAVRNPQAVPTPEQVRDLETVDVEDAPRLPSELRRSSPQMNNVRLRFESDRDRAGFVVANTAPRRNPRDREYLDYLRDHFGMDENQARAFGDHVRRVISNRPDTEGRLFVEELVVDPDQFSADLDGIPRSDPRSPYFIPAPPEANGVTREVVVSRKGANRFLQSVVPAIYGSGNVRMQISQDSVLRRFVEVDPNLDRFDHIEKFAETLRAGLNELAPGSFKVVGPDRGMFYVKDAETSTHNYASFSMSEVGGRRYVGLDTTGFTSGSSLGGKFYQTFYGALVSHGLRQRDGALTQVNRRRKVINRLRALLFWGSVHGDFNRVAESLALFNTTDVTGLPTARVSPSSADGLTTVQRMLNRISVDAFRNLPTPGTLTFNADGTFTDSSGVSRNYDQLKDWIFNHQFADDASRGAASPDVAVIASIATSLQNATPAEARKLTRAAEEINARLFSGGDSIFNTIFDPVDPPSEPSVLKAGSQGLSRRDSGRNDQSQAQADSMVEDLSRESPRESYTDVLTGIEQNQQAEPATISRGMLSRNAEHRASAWSRMFSTLNESLHDGLTPVNNWLKSLLNRGNATENAVYEARHAMYLAPGRRDHFLREAMLRHGGRSMQKAIGELAKEKGITLETALRWAGLHLTATHAPKANQRLIDRLTETLQDLQRQLKKDPTDQDLINLISMVTQDLVKRVKAVNNPDTSVKNHEVGLAGGLSNAQAAALRAAVEGKLGVKGLSKIAESVYDLNAFRLALDIETGKTLPSVAAKFLGMPDVEPLLKSLRSMAQSVDSSDPSSVAMLDAMRNRVAKAVRSTYVPMTGDPTVSMDTDIFSTSSYAPNVNVDQSMEGRQSIPDDGITATIGAMLKSTTYAGWRPFQESITKLYNSMDQDQRANAQIFRRTVQEGDPPPRDGMIVRGANGTHVYTFGDPKILEAIRKENMDDNSKMLTLLGMPNKVYSYMATQLNVAFGFYNNWFRDLWERSELVRTRDIRKPSGAKADVKGIARRMWKYGTNFEVARAAARFAAGRPSDGSRAYAALQQLSELGGVTTFGDIFSGRRDQFVTDIAKQTKLAPTVRRKIAQVIDVWNRFFSLIPLASSYMSMQDFGVANNLAAGETLDLFNYRKAGTAAPVMRMLYAFAQPSVTGGANILSSLVDPRTKKVNWRVGVPRLVSYTLALSAFHALARLIADDDEGGNKMDQLNDWVKYNTLPFPVGDKVVSIPLSFGITRIANSMALSMVTTASNEQTLTGALGKGVTASILPSFAPIDVASVDWDKHPLQAMLMTFGPSWLRPATEVAVNMSGFGSPVVNTQWYKTDKFRSDQGTSFTPDFYKNVAKEMRKLTGIDMAPEEVRHIIRGYSIGLPNLVLNGAVENPNRERLGRTPVNPLTNWLVRAPNEFAIYAQFKSGLSDLQELDKKYKAEDLTKLDTKQRRKLMLLNHWNDLDKKLKAQRAKITRNKQLSEEAKDKAKDRLGKTREMYQTDFVRRLRIIEGKIAVKSDT